MLGEERGSIKKQLRECGRGSEGGTGEGGKVRGVGEKPHITGTESFEEGVPAGAGISERV